LNDFIVWEWATLSRQIASASQPISVQTFFTDWKPVLSSRAYNWSHALKVKSSRYSRLAGSRVGIDRRSAK
jgi:hypothetical protein